MMNTWHQGADELLVVFITVGSHYGGLGDQITCYGALRNVVKAHMLKFDAIDK